MEPLFLINSIYMISPICRIRLYQLFNKFIRSYSQEDIDNLYQLIENKKSDSEIIEWVISRKNKKDSSAKAISTSITMDSAKRGEKFAIEWMEVLGDFSDKKFSNFLDIGCNTGSITVPFGKKLGLGSDQIHGIDITNFGLQTIKPIPGFSYQQYDGYHIPHPDANFDIVTCAMVLHHVEYPQILLPEIRRIMKPNAILLIKEHNCYESSLEWLIELEHMLYEVTESDTTYEDFKKRYYQKLFTKKSLDTLMASNGFTKIKIKSTKILKKYYTYNPTKNFYRIYAKIEI